MNYMRGSIRKRGKTFQYRFHIRDPITNERKELSKGGFEKEMGVTCNASVMLMTDNIGIFFTIP